jgi:hypothetical protein
MEAPVCKPKIPTIRDEVAAWMRNNRASYMEFGTGNPHHYDLAAGAASVYGRPDWLKDGGHWIWEEAITAFEGLPA